MTIDDANKPVPEFPELFAAEEIAPPQEVTKAEEPEPPFVTIQRDYQRVAKAIELMWGSRELDVYLQKLIVDERGGRAGFPQPVLAAIVKLYNQHAAQFRFKSAYDGAPDIWAEDPVIRRRQREDKPMAPGSDTPPKKS